MTQRYGGGHGNGVAGEETEFHTRRTLGYTIAHGGHTTSHLSGSPQAASFGFDNVWVMLQRRVGRKHVVVSVDNAYIGGLFRYYFKLIQRCGTRLIGGWHGGKCVCHIGTAHPINARRSIDRSVQLGQVVTPGGCAALDDAPGNGLNNRIKCHGSW